jgi:hypothetical protein
MNKADSSDTTTTSRRALLAGAPTVAAVALTAGAAVNCLAAARATSSAADPIFPLIKTHREAWTAHEEAKKLFFDLSRPGSHEATGICIGERPERLCETVEANPDVFHVRWVRTGTMIPIIACNLGEIERNAPKGLSESERGAWIDEKWAELRRFREAENERLRQGPEGVALQEALRAYGAMGGASDNLDHVTELLLSTRPTTSAGVAAALDHWAQFITADPEEDFEVDASAAFLVSLAAALRGMIGQQTVRRP